MNAKKEGSRAASQRRENAMCISRTNHEGYPDPTAYAALTNVMKESPFVYICSPYHDDPRLNVMRARRYCRFAVIGGRIPLAPHLYFPQFVSEATEREMAFRMNFELMKLCGEIWVFGAERSEGMRREMMQAEALKKTIRWFSTTCEEVFPCD